MTKPSRTLRYKVLMAITLCVIVAWSVLWFTAATIVDRQAEKAEHMAHAGGAIVECVNRSVSGFPFRIEVRCGEGSRIGSAAGSISLEGLTAAALIYRPSRLIVEARSPAVLAQLGADELLANWDLAHASARIDLTNRALARFDGEVKVGALLLSPAWEVVFKEADLHVRRNPEDAKALDIALSLADLTPIPDAQSASLSLQGMLHDGAAFLSSEPIAGLRALASKGIIFTLDQARFESGDMLVAANGELTLGIDGRVDGTIDLALAGYDHGLPYMKVVAPDAQATMANVLKNVLAFAPTTTIGARKAKKLVLVVKGGRVSVGLVPLFTIPPVQFPTHF